VRAIPITATMMMMSRMRAMLMDEVLLVATSAGRSPAGTRRLCHRGPGRARGLAHGAEDVASLGRGQLLISEQSRSGGVDDVDGVVDGWTQNIAESAHGVDERGLAGRLELHTKVADVHIQDVAVAGVSPDGREDPVARHDLPGRAQKEGEEAVLAVAQRDTTLAPADVAGGAVPVTVPSQAAHISLK
jgi:hypothetical protein